MLNPSWRGDCIVSLIPAVLAGTATEESWCSCFLPQTTRLDDGLGRQVNRWWHYSAQTLNLLQLAPK
ncbi:hypothetical protein SynPROS91_00833 [Synechococcus sp. PROS-9-1]|nr:hypothetical protein SynPROS91_00833 [Synechococcus sp. PROS-9-1]